MWRTGLFFIVASAALGESAEIIRLAIAGWTSAGGALIATLLIAYGLLGALVWGAVSLVAPVRMRLRLAASIVVLAVLLPWLNYDALPALTSPSSLLANVLAAALVVLLVGRALRAPRAAAALVLLTAGVVNAVWVSDRANGRAATDEPESRAEGERNLLVIVLDTVRADHLRTYGYRRPTSPHIDRLAAGGVVFHTVVAQSSWTKPSVASLLTGSFPFRHGAMTRNDMLGDAPPTLAEVLRGRGYRTAGFSANPWITPEFGFDRGFAHFEQTARSSGIQNTLLFRSATRMDALAGAVAPLPHLRDLLRRPSEANPDNAVRDRLLTERVTAWIRERGESPFFAYVHLMGAHNPYRAPEPFASRFRDPAWADRPLPANPPAQVRSRFARAEPLDDETRAMLIAAYDQCIAHADALVGDIVATLRERGLFEKTLIVVTSDHGEEFYEHGSWLHGHSMFGEVIRVPLVMHLPAALSPARRRDPVMLADLFPSVLGILGEPGPRPTLDGHDLFAAAPAGRLRTLFSEYRREEGGGYSARAVRVDEHKLIETRDGLRQRHRMELYDLETDPAEQEDLLEEADMVATGAFSRLKERLTRLQGEMPARAAARRVRMMRSTEERAHDLGY